MTPDLLRGSPAWLVETTTGSQWAVSAILYFQISGYRGLGLILRVPIFLVRGLQCPGEDGVVDLEVDLEMEDLEDFSKWLWANFTQLLILKWS